MSERFSRHPQMISSVRLPVVRVHEHTRHGNQRSEPQSNFMPFPENRLATTATSLLHVKTVGGSTDTLDPRASTLTLVTLSRNGHFHAARRDSDHLAPVGRRYDSSLTQKKHFP